MGDLDTRVDGTPESIRAVGRWLKDSFGTQADELATSVFRARSDAAGAWEGPASTAFGDRAKVLADAADAARDSGVVAEREVERLAAALGRALDDMATVRTTAGAAGLTVLGTVVSDPGGRLTVTGSSPAPDAPPQEKEQHERTVQRVATRNAKVDAFETACSEAEAVFDTWATAVEDASASWVRWDKELVSLTADFLTGAASAALVLKVAPILMGQSQFHLQSALRLRAHAASIVTPTSRVIDPRQFYRLLDDADAHLADAARYADDARNVRIPKNIGRALGILGIVATGYSIHEDMEEGESAAQAVTSNVGGLAAGMAAGALAGAPIGAAIGTAIPIPGVGTVAGLAVGAVVGSVVGAFTSGAIDSMFENGVDDVGAAVDAGLEEVGNLGEAVGDLASDTWDSIFG